MSLGQPLASALPVEVAPLATRRDRRDFIRLPWRIYRDDPQWVPPLEWEVQQFIDPRQHPFYHHGAAQPFLARRGGEPVGRILVSDDPHYNAEHGSNLGCFGMFETVDDPQVARALIDAAAAWLAGRGRNQLLGPIDYSTNYPCGLLIDGFQRPPRLMMNHHPRYYLPLLESCGLSKAKDLYAYWFQDPHQMLEKWKARAARLAQRGGFRVRPFDSRDFEREVARCKQVYHQAWVKNWGFVKMTDAEFDHLAQTLRKFARPELLMIAEAEGQPVGFSMTLPDFNEAVAPLNGRLTRWGLPVGLFQLWRGLRRITTARMLILGVLEEYRRRGITEMLILETLDYGRNQAKYTGAELSWTLEDNELINRTIEAVGGERYKTYRILEKSLA